MVMCLNLPWPHLFKTKAPNLLDIWGLSESSSAALQAQQFCFVCPTTKVSSASNPKILIHHIAVARMTLPDPKH